MNPMPVVMYLMGLEAEHGLLTELGFAKRPHPEGIGSSLYLREEALLHSTGLWYRGVLYHRPRERFYRAPIPPYPPAVHPEAEPLDFAEGLAHFLPFLKAYEDAVAQLRGEGRERFLRRLPPGARRHLKDWKALFAGGTYAQAS
ncbi:hypothetical protein BVI061214_00558 [Thermus aquaticus]|jgi:hypothetical protein|uniref:Uncharacterized protein n=1 Tax=Thermus aquaticus TaxID=271 RepID=A0A0M9ACR2_THEAQ|nr:hypothetical protein [Thermus aquaticus]KOX89397.1 hypothetical protein BVI061214_00558 [Thermus aquaticus]